MAAPQQVMMASSTTVDLQPDHPTLNRMLLCPHPLSNCLGICCCPLTLMCSCHQLNPKEQAAIVYWGKYKGTIVEPGLYYLNSFGLSMRRVSTAQRTMHLEKVKVLDSRGNPIIVSGVVTYFSTSAKKHCIDVNGPDEFLHLQATAVMKRIASEYPYEAPAGVPSLQTEGAHIASNLKHTLQVKTAVTGAQIISFDLVDLSYAPEIAQVMLVRQQAEALVDARRLIVSAAVDMTRSAVGSLKTSDKGELAVNEDTCQKIAANLLTVICSHSSATPTISMG